MRFFEWVLRFIVGGAFIYAGLSKILVPCELAMNMYHFQIAPSYLLNIGAIVLPYVEIILGGCLIVGIIPRGAALGLSLVLTFFIVLLGVNLIRGIDFECACFGKTEHDICNTIALKIKADQPDMDRVTFVRIRTGCDIVRDILLLLCSVFAQIFIHRRITQRSR
ncbi:DoxX family membrane protein [bacterium]|nr:DoxX family membrane protein [bacterium]